VTRPTGEPEIDPHRHTPVRTETVRAGVPGVHNDPVPTPSRPTYWGVLALPALAVVGLAVTIGLDLQAQSTGPGEEIAPELGWGYTLNGVALAAMAAWLLLRNPRQGIGWALAGFGVFWVLDGMAQSYVHAGLTADDAWPAMTAVLWFLNRFGAFLVVPIAVLLLIFPTGRFLPGRWGVAGKVSLTVMVLACSVVLVAPADQAVDAPLPPQVDPDPTTLSVLDGATWLVPAAVSLCTATIVVPMLTAVVRYRRSSGVERDRMRWLLWGVVAMAIASAVWVVLPGVVPGTVMTFVAMVLPALSITVAVADPALVSIQDLLTRTLLYGGLSLVIIVVDLAALGGLSAALGESLADREVVLVVLLVTALLYAPLRSWIAGGVRRLVLGERDNPYDTVAGLASTLETADEGPAQLAAVARAVAQAFGIAFVSVEVDRGGGERLVATHGERPAQTRTLPITYRDVPVGRLVLPARGLRSRLSRRDEQLLGDLVRQAATAARTSRLADELQESRERLVVTREEERRRIRRDLHDGLGPALSGVVFQLESARLLVDQDPGAAKARIAATSGHLQDVVADVRRLVHALRPPALDDRGLVGALAQQAEQLSAGGPVTTVEAGDLGSLPAAVEVAAFRIAGEALANVARHAGAETCTVRLCVDGGVLVVEVADDGGGIAPDAEAGVGLVSLRERAAELGGRSEVVCPDAGGTVVRAWLPLRREA
jgi:signal transduction histidine kinase